MANASTDLQALKRQYVRAVKSYYNADAPIMSDAEFDALEDKIRAADPNWDNLKRTGTKVANKKTEGPLFKFMPSLNKKYPDQLETHYKSKAVANTTRWIIMDKLDGTSLQVRYAGGRPTHLMTRGNGTLGGDVSFLLPALLAAGKVPKQIHKKEEFVVRLEGIMDTKVFASKWSREVKGKQGFDNIRNGVNGIFNRMEPHPALADVELVALGVYDTEVEAGLVTARELGFTVVRYSVHKEAAPEADALSELLFKRRKASAYEMDGLVMAPTKFIYQYQDADKPKGIIAFKVNEEDLAPKVKVLEIIWQKTRLKRWIPKIRIEPTLMDGVMVVNATSHNAKWMADRGIGPGAVVKVLRSGGVIPKIVDVVKVAKFKGPPEAYTVKGVHFVMVTGDRTSTVRSIHHFMTTLGIELLAVKTLDKLYDIGFTTPGTYVKLAHASEKVAIFSIKDAELGPVQSQKILTELRRVLCSPIKLLDLMVASGCFEHGGMGRRKLEQLEAGGVPMSQLILLSNHKLHSKILEVKGFKDKTAMTIVNGMAVFIPWLAKAEKYLTVDKEAKKKAALAQGPLTGINVSWTTYRSKEQEALVARLGGEVITFGAKTTVLLYDPEGKASTKVEKAGERAMVWTDFCRKYKISVKTDRVC